MFFEEVAGEDEGGKSKLIPKIISRLPDSPARIHHHAIRHHNLLLLPNVYVEEITRPAFPER